MEISYPMHTTEIPISTSVSKYVQDIIYIEYNIKIMAAQFYCYQTYSFTGAIITTILLRTRYQFAIILDNSGVSPDSVM